jgi:hypothetical protein
MHTNICGFGINRFSGYNFFQLNQSNGNISLNLHSCYIYRIIEKSLQNTLSQDISVDIAIGNGLLTGWTGFNSQQGQDFSLIYSIQSIFGDHPASYPIGTRYLGDKVAGM